MVRFTGMLCLSVQEDVVGGGTASISGAVAGGSDIAVSVLRFMRDGQTVGELVPDDLGGGLSRFLLRTPGGDVLMGLDFTKDGPFALFGQRPYRCDFGLNACAPL